MSKEQSKRRLSHPVERAGYERRAVPGGPRAASPTPGPVAWHVLGALMLGVLLVAPGCDTVEPESEPLLVAEGFLDAGRPLPPITLRQTRRLAEPYADEGVFVTDAAVALTVDGRRVPYVPVATQPGRYTPTDPAAIAPPGGAFAFSATWGAHQATAEGAIPARVRLDSIRIVVSERPVEATLLDSLLTQPIALDSLRFDTTGVVPNTSYIYPVEVTLWWGRGEAPADTASWIRARLRPSDDVGAPGADFFLRPEQVLPEADLQEAHGRRWQGVYAVPAERVTDPIRPHRLHVALLRSGPDYARFATSRDAPERREPISNLAGGIGIVAGVSIDSVTVEVR